jgi:hypothetical protein
MEAGGCRTRRRRRRGKEEGWQHERSWRDAARQGPSLSKRGTQLDDAHWSGLGCRHPVHAPDAALADFVLEAELAVGESARLGQGNGRSVVTTTSHHNFYHYWQQCRQEAHTARGNEIGLSRTEQGVAAGGGGGVAAGGGAGVAAGGGAGVAAWGGAGGAAGGGAGVAAWGGAVAAAGGGAGEGEGEGGVEEGGA